MNKSIVFISVAVMATVSGLSGCAKQSGFGIQKDGMVQLWEGGPYWATKNIGAEKPEDYGLYFWWGDTVGYRHENDAWVASDGSLFNISFNERNARSFGGRTTTLRSVGRTITKNGTDMDILAPAHDAAHVIWGGNWRMPTTDEIEGLICNCDWIWTMRNGVSGYVVRGRGDYVSASIFLPAAGFGFGTSLLGVGENGRYWSSVPNPDADDRDEDWRTSFHLSFVSTSYDDDAHLRYAGESIRPVQDFVE